MGRGDLPPLRSLPRLFLEGASMAGPIDLPRSEVDKLRKVLRLERGAPIAVLPGDGTLIRCRFEGHQAIPEALEVPQTEPTLNVTIAQAFPKGDRMETVVRMGTEIGVSRFLLFPADRSVVRWDAAKLSDRVRRYEAIAREAAEQCFRTIVPKVEACRSLGEVLEDSDAVVLSELEGESKPLVGSPSGRIVIVVGPEGGWSPVEIELIGNRGVTLGPRVLRTDTAGIAAAAALLFRPDEIQKLG